MYSIMQIFLWKSITKMHKYYQIFRYNRTDLFIDNTDDHGNSDNSCKT